MKQHDRIKEYIEQHGSITPYEAFEHLGITKLSTRISEMVKDGYEVKKELIHDVNRYGEIVIYMKYSA